MSLLEISGTLTGVGLDDEDALFSFVEIVDETGRKHVVRNIFIEPVIAQHLGLGTKGKFYFDSAIFVLKRRYHLWGISINNEFAVVDAHNIHKDAGIVHLALGALLIFLLIGFPILVLGTYQWLYGKLSRKRERLFFASGSLTTKRFSELILAGDRDSDPKLGALSTREQVQPPHG